MNADPGGGASQNSSSGGNGGGASGGAINLGGIPGNRRSASTSAGQYFHTPANGGVAGFVLGHYGKGGNGAGPTGGSATGGSGTQGVVLIYEYIV